MLIDDPQPFLIDRKNEGIAKLPQRLEAAERIERRLCRLVGLVVTDRDPRTIKTQPPWR